VAIIIQLILFCFYVGLEIVYLAKASLQVEFVVLALTTVLLIAIDKAVEIHSIMFIKQQLLRIATNM
jgi:hypothetical protein